MCGPLSQSTVFGVAIAAVLGTVLGSTMGYRWGKATTRWRDWRERKRSVPVLRRVAFYLIGRAMNPTGLLLIVLAVVSAWVYAAGQ